MEAKELKAKTPQELKKLVEDFKAELFNLRFRNSTGQLDQPHKIQDTKRNVAKIFTVLAQQKKYHAMQQAAKKVANQKPSSTNNKKATTKKVKKDQVQQEVSTKKDTKSKEERS